MYIENLHWYNSLIKSYLIPSTSICISILSKSGPLILFIYFFICSSLQEHFFSFEPKYPQGQGFILAINMKLHG